MARKKHPELTRTALIDAAQRISRMPGAVFSLEAVAREAGVSKGGLLHHYRSKEALLSALAHALIAQFRDDLRSAVDAEVAQHGDRPGKWLRAYIALTFAQHDEWRALSATLAPLGTYPDLIARMRDAQRFLIDEAEADGLPAGRAHAIRLACDGLMFGHDMGLPDLDAGQRAALQVELSAWTRS